MNLTQYSVLMIIMIMIMIVKLYQSLGDAALKGLHYFTVEKHIFCSLNMFLTEFIGVIF